MTTVLQLNQEVKRVRKQILDLLEGSYGGSTQWPLVRSRILHLFGSSGLEGLVAGLRSDERNIGEAHATNNETEVF